MGMEKRLVLAIVAMMAVVVIVNVLFPPPPLPQPPAAADSMAPGGPAVGPPTADSAAPVSGPEPGVAALAVPSLAPAPAADASEDTVWVEGPLFRLGFAQRGGRLVSARMTRFESLAPDTRGQPVELVPAGTDNFFTNLWVVGDDTLNLSSARFDISPAAGLLLDPGGGPQSLLLSYQPEGTTLRVELLYTFRPDSYSVTIEGRVAGVRATGWWAIGLGSGLQSNEWDPSADNKANLAFAGKGDGKPISKRVGDVAPGARVSLDGPFDWAAVRGKYFVAALVVPPEASVERRFAGVLITGTPLPYRAEGFVSFPLDREGGFSYRAYIGPQDYGRLKALHHDLDEVTPYGYSWLQPIIRPLAGAITSLLVWMHRVLGLGYGWILVIFGVGIRVLLFPLYQKSMRSQLATMRVQPLLKEIQDKYKNDPQRLQQEMLHMYREHGINPLGGCLPMLLPFPILIALFFVFRDTIEFRGAPFLWLPDLSRPDPYYIIPLLMGGSMLLLQWLGQRGVPQTNPQMKFMMWAMPIMFIVLFLNFASGLNLYYATMNVASLPQQLYLARERRTAGVQPAPARGPAPTRGRA
jgi:YidC/Oxa1 family membrane protein insertase